MKMEFDITKMVEEIAMQAKENQEEFIFQTIRPYCENILQIKINKEELKQILLNSIRKQQPCEDCISRESVYELLAKEDWADTVIGIKELPSVTPQPKIGYWEYVQYDNNPNIGNWHCSECRSICTEMHSIEDSYNYCPNCGAKMEAENEKETC